MARGLFGEAAVPLQKAARLNPESAKDQFNAGAVLVKLEQPDAARPYFERALQLRVDYVAALTGLAELLATHPDPQKRDAARASELVSQAIATAEQNGQVELAQKIRQQAQQWSDQNKSLSCS